MKLVEVVVLVGTQCISPVQHGAHHTIAGKVPCAVLIHSDEAHSRVRVTPAALERDPRVRVALARLMGDRRALPPVTTVDAGDQADNLVPNTRRVVEVMADPNAPPGKDVSSVAPEIIDLRAPAAAAQGVVPELPAPEETVEPSPDDDSSIAEAGIEEPAAAPDAPDEKALDAPDVRQAAAKPTSKKRKSSRSTATDSKIQKQTNNLRTVCRYPRVAKWYKNKSGRLKYRCVASGKQGLY